MPLHADEMLTDVAPVDDGPVAALALAENGAGPSAYIAAGISGPVTVGRMLDALEVLSDRIAALDGRADKALSDEYHHHQDRIAASRPTSFTEAILSHGAIDSPHVISVFSSLIARQGASATLIYCRT
jgi:hypothetical protein